MLGCPPPVRIGRCPCNKIYNECETISDLNIINIKVKRLVLRFPSPPVLWRQIGCNASPVKVKCWVLNPCQFNYVEQLMVNNFFVSYLCCYECKLIALTISGILSTLSNIRPAKIKCSIFNDCHLSSNTCTNAQMFMASGNFIWQKNPRFYCDFGHSILYTTKIIHENCRFFPDILMLFILYMYKFGFDFGHFI